jgi:hypothetical protein
MPGSRVADERLISREPPSADGPRWIIFVKMDK